MAVMDVEARDALAQMMLRCSIPTGHGDTFMDLLRELEGWIHYRQGEISVLQADNAALFQILAEKGRGE